MRNKFPKVNGADSAIAQGHAIISTAVRFCNRADDYRYYLFFNSGSNTALYSTIQYSTSPDFSFNTGSLVVSNSLNTYKIAIVKCLLMLLVIFVKPSSLFLLKTSLLHNCVK